MKFFAVHLEDLESERFLAASNDQIATWLFLHALCSKQMNGATIPAASTIPERFWSRHGIDKRTLEQESPLWAWSGESLIVEPYDIDGQSLYEKKVKGGKDGAKKRWSGNLKGTSKVTPKETPKGTPNRPDPTRDNPSQPDKTSSRDKGGSLFPVAGDSASEKNSDELFDYWNSFQELTKIRDVTPKRKSQLNARMKEDFFRDNWKTGISKIAASPFLRGTNDRGWKACIDWILTPGNIVKVIEGKYDSQTSKPPTTVNTGRRMAPTSKQP